MDPATVPPGQPATDVASCPAITWAFTCIAGTVEVHATIPTTPFMGREPDTVPDFAGGGYDGFLAWGDDQCGVLAGNSGRANGYGFADGNQFGPQFTCAGPDIGGPHWQGVGAQSWALLVNGAVVGSFGRDGLTGPFTISVTNSGPVTSTPWNTSGLEPVIDIDWYATTNVAQLVAYYFDRPSFRNSYVCSPFFTYFGLLHPTGYFDMWVDQHHSVPFAADRNGGDLGFAGPWGASIPPQTFRDGDPICDTSLLVTNCSLTAWEAIGEVAYPVACPPQPIPPANCPPATGVHVWKRWGRI